MTLLPGIYRTRARVRTYLFAEFFTIGFLAWAEAHYGRTSLTYTILYAVMRAVELAAILRISGAALWGLVLALPLTYGVYLFRTEELDWNGLILLCEGFCYTLAAVSTRLRHSGEANYIVLAALWLVLGLFSLGYGIGGWVSLNPGWQATCCIAGFGIIGCLPRTAD
jgi:hypothetical protein